MKKHWSMGVIMAAGILATTGCEKKSTLAPSTPPKAIPVIELPQPATQEQRKTIAAVVHPYLDARLDRYELTEKLYDLKEQSPASPPDPQIAIIQDRLSILRGREARQERILRGLPGIDGTPWIADVWELTSCITQVETCLAEIYAANHSNPPKSPTEKVPLITATVAKQDAALKRIEELNEKLGKALENP